MNHSAPLYQKIKHSRKYDQNLNNRITIYQYYISYCEILGLEVISYSTELPKIFKKYTNISINMPLSSINTNEYEKLYHILKQVNREDKINKLLD